MEGVCSAHDFFHIQRVVNLSKKHTCERNELIQTIKEMFEAIYRSWIRYRTTSIYFGELLSVSNRQDSLFDFDENRRKKEQDQRKLLETIESINHKLWGMHITTGTNADAIKKMDGSEFAKMRVN
jgi:hypothetical protein